MAKRILVVSDNSAIRTLIVCALGIENYDIIESENPSDAVERIQDGSLIPDLVIISLDAHEADTCGLIKRLRGHPSLRRKPILTAADRGMLDKQMELLLSGGAFWIEKPFTGSELARVVEMMLF